MLAFRQRRTPIPVPRPRLLLPPGVVLALVLGLAVPPTAARPEARSAASSVQTSPSLLARCLGARIRALGLHEPHSIRLSEEAGRVRLDGTVATLADREAVASLVESDACVRFVEPGLVIRPPANLSEEAIRLSVLEALEPGDAAGQDYVAAVALEATLEAGKVELGGLVRSTEDKHRAASRVRRLPGVVELRNRIAVEPEAGLLALEVEVKSLLQITNLPRQGLTVKVDGDTVLINGLRHDIVGREVVEEIRKRTGSSDADAILRFVRFVVRPSDDGEPERPQEGRRAVGSSGASCPCGWRAAR